MGMFLSKEKTVISLAINSYIQDQMALEIQECLKKMKCLHVWKKEGFGYTCKKCGHYTGLDETLNRKIKDLNNDK